MFTTLSTESKARKLCISQGFTQGVRRFIALLSLSPMAAILEYLCSSRLNSSNIIISNGSNSRILVQ